MTHGRQAKAQVSANSHHVRVYSYVQKTRLIRGTFDVLGFNGHVLAADGHSTEADLAPDLGDILCVFWRVFSAP